jgi:hypothetical protein
MWPQITSAGDFRDLGTCRGGGHESLTEEQTMVRVHVIEKL